MHVRSVQLPLIGRHSRVYTLFFSASCSLSPSWQPAIEPCTIHFSDSICRFLTFIPWYPAGLPIWFHDSLYQFRFCGYVFLPFLCARRVFLEWPRPIVAACLVSFTQFSIFYTCIFHIVLTPRSWESASEHKTCVYRDFLDPIIV